MARISHPADPHEQYKDNLKKIRGIGPAMEQRLNHSGIFTFAQIAELSPKDLAAVFSGTPCLSVEKIIEKGWVNQARYMMEKEKETNNLTPEENGQHSIMFSVDLLLDNKNHVRRTHILHIQSRKENSWAGWNQNQLVGFILENANIKCADLDMDLNDRKLSVKSSLKDKKQVKIKELRGDLNIAGIEVRPEPDKAANWLVTAKKPFATAFMLDMSKAFISPGTLVQYQVEIYAKNLADGIRQKIGEEKNTIKSKHLTPLVINCRALPQGSYRIEAFIVLALDLEDQNPRSRLMAMTEGTVFRVS
jgi:hypothetical protein